MIIIQKPITIQAIKESHASFFSTMVKIVVDVEKQSLALDGEMHSDLEELLLNEGSSQKDLWGANIYFDRPDYVEFTSLINIRPSQGNRSMEVLDKELRKRIQEIVKLFIQY